MSDNVNHPSHYTRFGKSEVIDITEELNFNRGSAVKYLSRAGHKVGSDELEDLKKAQFHVNREVKRVEAAVIKKKEAEKAKLEKEEAEEKIAALKRRLQGHEAAIDQESDVVSRNYVGYHVVEPEEVAFGKPVFLRDSTQQDQLRQQRESENLSREAAIQHVQDELKIKGYAHVASKNSVGFHIVFNYAETFVNGKSFFVARCGKIDFDSVRLPDSRDGRCFICGTMRPGKD